MTTTNSTTTENKKINEDKENKIDTSNEVKAESKDDTVQNEVKEEVKKDVTPKTQKKSKKERKKLINYKTIFKHSDEYALRLKNVKKNYGLKKVLKGVTFDIKKGERLAMIGKNGAGKSTLINVIAQQTKMSEGEIRYGYASTRVESLERMGIQFQSLNYPEGFIVKDVIKFFNSSVDKSIRMSSKELSDMISMFGIDKYLNQSIDRLSGGQQQRINILLALIKKPHLLILDEISTGLDVESSEVIKGYIDQFLQKYPNTALLLISHSDEEIREMSSRVVVLEAGKIVEDFESKKLTNKLFYEITSRQPKLTKKEQEKLEQESERHLKQLRRRYFDKENIRAAREIKETQEAEIKKVSLWQKMILATESFKHKIDRAINPLDNHTIDKGNAVEIRGISKTYGKTVGAVRNVSLDIEEGSRIAITGPNGSGKSTIVEIIAQVKTADKEKDRYKNARNLAKADYERTIKSYEENLNVYLRQQKNKYRLERELAYNEARELEKSKNVLAKEAQDNAKLKANKEGASKKAIELSKRSLDEFRADIDKKINKIIDKADKEAELAKNVLFDKEIDLSNKLVAAKERATKKFEDRMKSLDEQEKKAKEFAKKQSEENASRKIEYKAKFEEDSKVLKKRLEESIDAALHKSNKKELKAKYEQDLSDWAKNDSEKKALLKEAYDAELAKMKIRDYEFEKELKTKYNKNLEALTTKNNNAKQKIIDTYNDKLSKMVAQDKDSINKLKLKYEQDQMKLQAKFDSYKQSKYYRYSDGFVLDGKELKDKEYYSDKPTLAYSFADTGRQVRDNVGVQFQYASFPVEMTVLDVILFFSRTNKYFMTKEEIVEAVKVFKLEKLLKARAYSLSGGERQRLNVLLAIMKSPKLLILDEISTGLDVDSIVKIDAFIKDYLDRTNATLILISHNYHEVDSLTDKIVVMKYGQLTEIVDTKGWTTSQTKDKMRAIYKGGGN